MSADKPLQDKVALVTGAGQNIGRAIALHLAAAGATVMVNGRSNKEAIDETVSMIAAVGGTAEAYLADVSDEAAVSAMMDYHMDRFARIDILVSNAGLRRQIPFTELTYADWREVMSVALDGAFLLSRAVVPHMRQQGGGAIICMSGMSNHIGTKERAHVNASKAGLEGLVRGLAMELASDQITVNAIAPGAIDTVRGAAAGPLPPGLAEQIPLGRRGHVDEIAAMVRHLAGPEGRYTTGQCLHINGGTYFGH